MSNQATDNFVADLPAPGPAPSRVVAVGVAIVALAAVLRLAGLAGLELWLDEVHTYIASTDRLPNLLLWQTIEQQYHSPLPYILVKLSRAILGGGAWGMRMPSALHGIVAVAALYVVVGRSLDWRTAAWSALLLAISPFTLEHAREARMYSHWLCWAIVLAGVALAVVRRALDARPALGWWFALGLVGMVTHASALHGLTTVAALALWLVIVIAASLRTHGTPVALRLLVGSSVTGATFLMSWSLAGLGKLMMYLKPPGGSSRAITGEMMTRQLTQALRDINGTVPLLVAVSLSFMALAGLVMLAMRRQQPGLRSISPTDPSGVGAGQDALTLALSRPRNWEREPDASDAFAGWQLPLLLVLIALAPLLMFPMAAAKMAFYSRYMQASALAWAVGLGAVAAAAWHGRGPMRRPAQGAVLLSLGVLAALWWPHWREIYAVPKMRVTEAFAPIRQHSVPGQVVVMTPHWGDALTKYHPLGKGLSIVYLPGEGYLKAEAPPEPINDRGAPPRRAFASVFGAKADDRPESAWVFMVLDPAGDAERQVARLEPLFEALNADAPAVRRRLADAAQGCLTLTAHLTPQGVEHLTVTRGRVRGTPAIER